MHFLRLKKTSHKQYCFFGYFTLPAPLLWAQSLYLCSFHIFSLHDPCCPSPPGQPSLRFVSMALTWNIMSWKLQTDRARGCSQPAANLCLHLNSQRTREELKNHDSGHLPLSLLNAWDLIFLPLISSLIRDPSYSRHYCYLVANTRTKQARNT